MACVEREREVAGGPILRHAWQPRLTSHCPGAFVSVSQRWAQLATSDVVEPFTFASAMVLRLECANWALHLCLGSPRQALPFPTARLVRGSELAASELVVWTHHHHPRVIIIMCMACRIATGCPRIRTFQFQQSQRHARSSHKTTL